MKGNHDLFDLIKSLDRSEKRHFKLFCNLQKGQKHYLKLFDEIHRIPKYNERELRLKLKDHPVSKHWAANKKYLYEKILESLSQIKLKDDSDFIVSELNRSYKILRTRGLNSQAVRRLSSARKLAKQKGLRAQYYEILTFDIRESIFSDRKIILAKALEIADEQNKIVKVMAACSTAVGIFVELEKMARLGVETKDIARISELRTQLVKLQDNLGSEEESHLCSMAVSSFQRIAGMTGAQGLISRQLRHGMYDIFSPQSQSQWKTIAMGSFLTASLQTGKMYEEKWPIWVGKSLHNNSNTFRMTRYEQWFYINMVSKCKKGDFDASVTWFLSERTSFMASSNIMSKWGRVNAFYAIAYAYFGHGDLDSAIKWLLLILDGDEDRYTVYFYAKLLQLIIFFERNDIDMIDYKMRSLERYIKAHTPEYLLLFKLRKIFTMLNEPASKRLDCGTPALLMMEQLDQPQYAALVHHLDLISWIKCKIQGIKFSQCVENRFKACQQIEGKDISANPSTTIRRVEQLDLAG